MELTHKFKTIMGMLVCILFIGFILTAFIPKLSNVSPTKGEIPKLDNPMSEDYLKKNLRNKRPRLMLTQDIQTELQQNVQSDPVVSNVYKAFKLNAEKIMTLPLLERKKIGRRLLSVSREMVYRINMLGILYAVEQDKEILDRIDQEVQAVCKFSDWNPSHYLDVAEMSLAVALALDWTTTDLPASTIEMAQQALIEKGIKPSYNPDGNTGWVDGTNNWNQVCHGGMIAAAIEVAEIEPELASKTISRALDGMPHALVEYGPDGSYPEGSTYWAYGTSYSVMTSSMLESAFGKDFGLGEYPAFKESAIFRVLSIAPTGWYYNFADCGDKRSENGDFTLAWFALKTGNEAFFEKERFMRDPSEMGELTRTAGAGLIWLSQFEANASADIPTAWKAEGSNPIVIFTGGEDDANQYYLGAKGGRGTVNHGNMDGGSFVFELDGIRWGIDPGNQSYHELEKTGFQLWGKTQDAERWKLLNKNNYGHSTLTVNGQLHVVDGMASIVDFQEGTNPEATIELSPTFEGQLKSARRRFVKDSPRSVLIEDYITKREATDEIIWQMMTQADVEIVEDGAILKQDGKQLKLENLSHPEITASIVSLDPPPFHLDRRLEGLKRIELRIPAYVLGDGEEKIAVRLAGL